jgi:hypothetical protein
MTTTNDDYRPGNGDTARRERERDERIRYARDPQRHSDFRDDIHKHPDELEREADRARASLESTLEALERRLSPGELLDQMLNVVKENGGVFGRNLATQVRNNPVPVLLTGIGMTWLMAASDRPPQRAYRNAYGYYGYEGEGYSESLGERAASMGHSIGESASSMGDSVRGTVTQAGESARATAEQARQSAQGMADRAREGATHARDAAMGAASNVRGAAMGAAHGFADSTRAGAESVWEGYDYLKREQPLVLGALAVAAGALVGAMLPGTRAEDRMMGEYSEEAKERLQEEARQRADQARDAAAEAAEAARESVQPKRAERSDPQGGSGSSAARS